MKTLRSIALLITTLMSSLMAVAQDVIVTVSPAQDVLPPQVLLYLNDPGKYFNITLTNTSASVQQVYLGLQLEQTSPASGLAISTPPKRQPQKPFVIQPGASYQLTTLEMKKLFDHIPASEISCPPNLFTDYNNGSFGLLPEGVYQVHVTAYRWRETTIVTPEVVSNPTGGVGLFRICYKAQSPDFITPTLLGTADPSVAEVNPLNAQFTWTTPVIACGSGFSSYTYDLRIVELLNGQQPDYAINHNPIIYQSKGLLAPTCIIPPNVIKSKFYANQKYVAQITAQPKSGNPLDYVQIANDGKSSLRIFRIKTDDEPTPPQVTPPAQQQEEEEQEEQEEEDTPADDDIIVAWGNESIKDSINPDSLYTFRNPTITGPKFIDIAARKIFTEQPLVMEWKSVFHVGGEGQDPETLEFSYEVQLFNNKGEANKEEALKGIPIYTKTFTQDQEFKDSISWESLQELAEVGDYLVLRIKPTCTNGTSVAFTNDSVNVLDFALVEPLSKKYFECANTVEITNYELTTASAEDLKGKVVAIGEYELTIDEIEAGKEEGTWEGTGRVEWNPLGTTVMVCVKFSDLKINTDNMVIAGTASTYASPEMSDAEVVEKLFSDWGIDNLIGDANLPCADYLTSSTTDKAKDLAKKIDLSKYYSWVKKGKMLFDMLGKGNIDKLYFPISIPKDINKSPVDLQIAGMKFAATHATMDIIGQFTLPKSNYLKNDILVLGAPRLCISPDKIIPEGGTVALLSDFGIKDPESSFELTFKAPQDLLKPQNGCFLSWSNYEFEMFGLDIDMKIPGLKKDVNGVATDEMPTLNISTTISSWDDWLINNVSIDPFQVEKLPGWTFTVKKMSYDHSVYRNAGALKFPTNYDQSLVLTGGNINSWQGLYIDSISVKMPKSLEFGTSGDRRLEIFAANMLFDQSGASLTIGANNVLSAKTGSAGGWAFSLDKVSASFVQSNFTHCGFSGKFDVPLLEGEIGYNCQIIKVNNIENSAAGNYAYVFKVQQVEGLSLDCFLATATFDKDLSYILVEAVPEKNELVTRVEMLMSGDLTIGGEMMKKKMGDLAFDLNLPGIHFSKMRLANCKPWESQFEDIKSMQTNKDTKKVLLQLYEGKEIELVKDKCYFHTGQWSLASMEKDLGPFKLTLEDFSFEFKNDTIHLGIEGTIKLLQGIDLSASTGITVKAGVKGLKEAMGKDFSKLDLYYAGTDFNKASFSTSFAGISLSGSLTAVKNDKEKGNGYAGTLTFTMPGDLFTAKAHGGYYERPDFTWGYFYAAVGSSTGIQIPPVAITDISAGFYFNCVRKDETDATPQKGVIGIVAGLGIASSAGKDVMGGTFEMTVVYDKDYVGSDGKRGRLTTFMLTGTLSAVSGMINSKASIVYQEDDLDKYFALNITVDANVDGGNIGAQVTALSEKLTKLQKQLNSKMESTVSNATGGLSGVLSDQSGEQADAPKDASIIPDKPVVGDLSITLDLRITMKENGKKLNKVKWHLYLGEPEESKRCRFTLIDFKSKIVSVNIGANAYLCVGNELPGDGALPAIPTEISRFLDGSTQGDGVQSDDISKAENARAAALKEFQSDVRGGVMLGASAWGYVDVDLGLFYGKMGALAGFDVSLRHLGGTNECMNMPRVPGYNGWYAEGQLYAYLYTKFGIRINLGFWKDEIDLVDAEIGGVLRMGMPNPTYFTGKARVKVRLLAGLVDIDRKFQFECGDRCDLFHGNALDNFKLFGDCSLGDTLKNVGWDKENAINPRLYTSPYINTEAPIGEHFRVLDENELDRLAKNYDGDREALTSQANRTFVFKMNSYVALYEYNSANTSQHTRRVFYFKKGKMRFKQFIDMLSLSPNKYYMLVVHGSAKEIVEGKEVDPVNYDPKTKTYSNKRWEQEKRYYFCTGASEEIPDCPNLQDYVAVAYPSDYNKLKSNNQVYAYVLDVQCPTLALFSDISKKAFKKGKLYWRLYNGSGKLLVERENQWLVTDSTCNMYPQYGFYNVPTNKSSRMTLVYEWSYTTVKKMAIRDPRTRAITGYQMRRVVETKDTTLMDLNLYAVDKNWREGYWRGGKSQVKYDIPFQGARLNYVIDNYALSGNANISDENYALYNTYQYGNKPRRFANPYVYLSYMSNYALVGGWSLSNKKLKTVNATTSQSLIYHDMGGSYEGSCPSSSVSTRIYNQYYKIRALSTYDKSEWRTDGLYQLPVQTDGKYSYVLGGNERAYRFNQSQTQDNKSHARHIIGAMRNVYDLAEEIDYKLYKELKAIDNAYGGYGNGKHNNMHTRKNRMNQYMESKVGIFVSKSFNCDYPCRVEFPFYQLAVLWGGHYRPIGGKREGQTTDIVITGMFDNYPEKGSRAKTVVGKNIYYGILGSGNAQKPDAAGYGVTIDGKSSKNFPRLYFTADYNNISRINVTFFRINTFNFKRGEYSVRTDMGGNSKSNLHNATIGNPLKF